MKCLIIIPAHNEEKRITNTLNSYLEFFERLRKSKKINYELLVSINASKDNTLGITKRIARKYDTLKFIDLKKGGKGYAITEAFKWGILKDFDLIGFVDADMATSPEEYYKLIIEISKDKSLSGAIADRYIKGSKVYPPVTFRRLIVGRIFNILARILFFFPFRDTQCGAKIFRNEAIVSILPGLNMTRWAFDIQLLHLLVKNKFKVASVPTIWTDKEYSKINFLKAGPWMALAIIRLRLVDSPLRKFVRVYDKLIGFVPIPK